MLQKLADISRNIIGNLFNIHFCMTTVGRGSEKHMIFAIHVNEWKTWVALLLHLPESNITNELM